MEKNRCAWVNLNNPLYVKYHDEEWGRPVYDDRVLFEFLVLEWAQAGLSWETILKRREGYRDIFFDFDVQKCSELTDIQLEAFLKDERIIRNRLKVFSVRKNAQVFQEIQKQYGSFSDYLWGFVNNKQIVNHPKALSEVSVKTELSDMLSKDLKKRGMSFVGSTIIYAYLQAVGVVDDHTEDCFCKR